jgi:hypothetical protein
LLWAHLGKNCSTFGKQTIRHFHLQKAWLGRMNMKKFANTGWLALASVILFPTIAFCSGFYYGAQSAKAMSLGNAFVAQADDPSALYYNPAGIVQLDSTQVAAWVCSQISGFAMIGRINGKAVLCREQRCPG